VFFVSEGSIRRKLLLFFVFTTGLALLLASVSFAIYDVIAFRQNMVKGLEVVADGIGINSSAALTFGVQDSGEDVLQSLRAYPNIVSAFIFDSDGRVFSAYTREDLKPADPPPLREPGFVFEQGALNVFRELEHDGEKLGVVFVASDMEALYSRISRFAVIMTLVMTGALVVALLLARRLEGNISGPILRLAEVESRVSLHRDYSLRALKETDDEVGILIDGFNEMLDEIQKRDAELTKRNRDLQEKNDEILRTQMQLVQSEKMASLGQLVAGVAHEINNPVNFISSGLPSLRRDVLSLAELVPPPAREQLYGKLQTRIGKLLDAIADGASRTAEIVKDLRSFSRLDEAVFETANLHEAIDATLTLLHNKTKGRVDIVKNYGDIPEVDCYISQLNQVFMNLLSNAVQAINGEGSVTITTERCGSDRVLVSIRDTGCGIPETNMKKIFDPFFTTKDVGEGTGLGLSISHGIIEKHQGTIEVTSEPGRGTEFRIILPVNPSRVEPSAQRVGGGAPTQHKVTQA